MKMNSYLKIIVSLLVYLMVSLPIIFAQELNLQYDAVGNLVTGDGFYREYDSFNHLIRIKQGNTSSGNISEEFIWYPLEERVFIKKIYWNNQTLRTTIKYLNKNTIKIKNESGTFYENYIYQDDILVAQRDSNGNKYAIHNDHLGSVSLITNSAGNIVENLFYSPFGEQLQTLSNSRYTFTGKEFDTLNNEYDFMSRRSKPEWANRLTTPDKIFYDFTKYEDERIKSYYNPQGLNPYSYALNNPYNYVDKDGNYAVAVGYLALAYLIVFEILPPATFASISVGYFILTKINTNPDIQKVIEQRAEENQASLWSSALPVVTPPGVSDIPKRSGEFIQTVKDVIEDKRKRDQISNCDKCTRRTVNDNEGNLFIATYDNKGKEVDRKPFSSSGGRGGSNVVPDPAGRKDRFGNPVYVPKSEVKNRR